MENTDTHRCAVLTGTSPVVVTGPPLTGPRDWLPLTGNKGTRGEGKVSDVLDCGDEAVRKGSIDRKGRGCLRKQKKKWIGELRNWHNERKGEMRMLAFELGVRYLDVLVQR